MIILEGIKAQRSRSVSHTAQSVWSAQGPQPYLQQLLGRLTPFPYLPHTQHHPQTTVPS